jgi:hypothetical protein
MAVNLENLDQFFRDDPDGQFAAAIKAAWPTVSAVLWAARDVYVEEDETFDGVMESILTPIKTNQEGYANAKRAVDGLAKHVAQYDDPDDPWMNDRHWGGSPQTTSRRQEFGTPRDIFGGQSTSDVWRDALAKARRELRQYTNALAELGHPVE